MQLRLPDLQARAAAAGHEIDDERGDGEKKNQPGEGHSEKRGDR